MDPLDKVTNIVLTLSPAQWCQTFFTLCTAVILLLQALPQDIRGAFFNYGARRPQNDDKKQNETESRDLRGVGALLKSLTDYGQVPHSWFLHFYIVSVSSSAFWAWQYLSRGSVMKTMAQLQVRTGTPSMDVGQVYIAWLFMTAQGFRRLYESLYVSKPGSSPMWAVHWAFGLAFYTTMGVAIWVEGSGAILASWDSPQQSFKMPRKMPSALALYFVACLKQNQCHRYLASLKKYTLPSEGWFDYIVCPHYTCECLLYVGIAWIAAPPGRLFNTTVLCGLLLVAVNLGATAHGTKKWYQDKFGVDKVSKKWTMIPGAF